NKVCDDFLHMMEEAGFKEAVQDLMDLGLDNNTSYSPLYPKFPNLELQLYKPSVYISFIYSI
ncbi:hypothetical protein, partial [Methanomethylophilus alvi]|uniref:hypothetical protein n=1 Tax=Methanomethylophilus alvi TaxID=1291540 RepID=UPI0037DD4907